MDTAAWKARAEAVTDAELADFRRRICVHPDHPGLAAVGACGRCGGGTPSCSMSLCERCARELGVCPFDQRLTGWGRNSAGDPVGLAARWLALLRRGYAAERTAAERALARWPDAAVAAAARDLARPPAPAADGRSPARAEFIVGFHGRLPADLVAGARFLDATVVGVDAALAFAVVRSADAAAFEARALRDPRVRYLELNRATAELAGGVPG